MCNYQGHEFGAHYPDSVCIDGRLFDADRCDDEGNLYEPMDWIACPQCNHAQWLADQRDEIEEMGAVACGDGAKLTSNPFRKMRIRFPRDRRRYVRWWNRGFREAQRESANAAIQPRAEGTSRCNRLLGGGADGGTE